MLGQVLRRINAGGGPYVDWLGTAWQADAYYAAGTAVSRCPQAIAKTVNDNLYCSYRSCRPNQTQAYLYNFPVTSGTYNVSLHFAEL